MILKKPYLAIHFKAILVVLFALAPSQSLGQGKQDQAPAKASRAPRADSKHGTAARRSVSSRVDIDQLRTEVDALHSLVIEQQRLMVDMRERLDAMQARDSAPAVLPASSRNPGELATLVDENPSGIVDVATPSAEGKAIVPETSAGSGGGTAIAAEPSSARQQGRQGLLAGWGDDHAFIRNSTGTFETRFMGYSQLDFRGYSSGLHPPNTFIVRRARMANEGTIDRYFEWRIEGDFADTNSTLLRDFYVNIHRIDQFVMRFGQTREPYSQEEMRSDNFQEFVERSMANDLAPSRSPGMMAYGSLGDGLAEYQIGLFNGKGLLAKNNNGTPDTALRLRFNPFRRSQSFWLKGLIVGTAINQGRNFNGTSITGTTPSQITFFQSETINGRVYRSNGEVSWLLGPAALRAEYDQSNQLRANLGPRGTNLPGVIGKAYMAQFTYLLTGEDQPDIGYIVPKHPLFDRETNGKIGLGAWQVKFRYDNLQINDGTPRSNRAETFYFGPNWYMNRWVRYVLDIGIERFNHPAGVPRPNQNFFTVLTQIQLQL